VLLAIDHNDAKLVRAVLDRVLRPIHRTPIKYRNLGYIATSHGHGHHDLRCPDATQRGDPERRDGDRATSGGGSHRLKLKSLAKVLEICTAYPVLAVEGRPPFELRTLIVIEDLIPEVDPAELAVVMVAVGSVGCQQVRRISTIAPVVTDVSADHRC
jgi:hypothetical protein